MSTVHAVVLVPSRTYRRRRAFCRPVYRYSYHTDGPGRWRMVFSLGARGVLTRECHGLLRIYRMLMSDLADALGIRVVDARGWW